MNIGIVILNYKNYQLSAECADHLLKIGVNARIVIVDNCSPNESLDELNKHFKNKSNVDIIGNKNNGGYAAGNNIGAKYLIEHYQIDAVCILNPDISIPYKEFFNHLYKKLFSDEQYAVISGICVQNDDFNMGYSCWSIPTAGELLKLRTRVLHKKSRLQLAVISKIISEGVISVDCLVGCCFMIKSSSLEKIGYFDENTFLYNEENILGLDIKSIGQREVLSINDYYYHNHHDHSEKPKTLKEKLQNEYYDFQSTSYLLEKYYPHWTINVYKVIHKSNLLYLSLMYLFKNKLLKK